MEGYEILGFLGILMECMKATKNGNFTPTITTISKSLSTKPAISGLLTQENLLNLSNPNTLNFADSFEKITNVDLLNNIIAIELVYFLLSMVISLYSMSPMILATAVAYRDKKLSSRDSLSRILKMFLRTLDTQFHLLLFGTGYVGLFLAMFFSLMILTMHHFLIKILLAITLCFSALIFRMSLAVVWDFALVISAIEKSCYGLEALGKAEGIVKGKRLLYRLALRFLYTVVTVIRTKHYGSHKSEHALARTFCPPLEVHPLDRWITATTTPQKERGRERKLKDGGLVIDSHNQWRPQLLRLKSSLCYSPHVSPSKGSSKKEVIMVDPLEAKRLAAKQMEVIKAKEKLKRRRQIEAINGAWAMIGLTAGLVIEGQTGNSILSQLVGYWEAIVHFFVR
ncbi:hypothetical protein Vadar_027529 [Vaccinium darrowii]|uniref:Uncharacterized protein n=1 Tax=Vaccinium darrowii TaxID=229202 RepID=A0ACB7Z848_9ERIC|nr:hypothetical protein Vadar_027529 [Vaccinium darrowii]